MQNKTARNSSSSTPYLCKQNWEESTFCQCGGDGVVFTDKNSLEKTLTDPEEQKEALKAVLCEDTTKAHYRTAFFEAFPKNPRCFLRGEGQTIEAAELDAWNKYQRILHCKEHIWDRRDRDDGYAFCTQCPLSGTFLEPLTKCKICDVPTAEHQGKDKIVYCHLHYYELNTDEAIPEMSFIGKDSMKNSFELTKAFFKAYVEKLKIEANKQSQDEEKYVLLKIKEEWEKYDNVFLHQRCKIEAHYAPLFKPRLKTKEEVNQIITEMIPLFLVQAENVLLRNKSL